MGTQAQGGVSTDDFHMARVLVHILGNGTTLRGGLGVMAKREIGRWAR